MKSVIPSFITGTPEERIAKWKAYMDNGITLIDSSDDKNWIESEPEIEEEPKPELNAETGNISCSDELIGIATLGGPISGTISPESYCTSCTVSLYDSFLIDTIVKENSIELVYKEVSIWNGLDKRVYKIVYSCLDGKWHKSDRIYGEIIPEQVIEETYKF